MGTRYSSSSKGALGEEIALHYLYHRGYELVERNFRCPYGEVDIIASKSIDLCFIEVKAWCRFGYEELEQSISIKKQKRIIDSARAFICHYQQFSSCRPRFGVLFINLHTTTCRYIKNAFEEEYEWHEPHD